MGQCENAEIAEARANLEALKIVALHSDKPVITISRARCLLLNLPCSHVFQLSHVLEGKMCVAASALVRPMIDEQTVILAKHT